MLLLSAPETDWDASLRIWRTGYVHRPSLNLLYILYHEFRHLSSEIGKNQVIFKKVFYSKFDSSHQRY